MGPWPGPALSLGAVAPAGSVRPLPVKTMVRQGRVTQGREAPCCRSRAQSPHIPADSPAALGAIVMSPSFPKRKLGP